MRCCVDGSYQPFVSPYEPLNQTIKINEFQLCKKGQILSDKIEMEMTVVSHIMDDELLEECKSLQYSVEIGEIHERDKYQWAEYQDLESQKKKKLEFDFKMNHIKQVVSIDSYDVYRSK